MTDSIKQKKLYKVVIIGAGIIGSTIATQLCSLNHPLYKFNITLIDQYDPRKATKQYESINTKYIPATYVSPGWINSMQKSPNYYNVLNRLSLEMWPHFLKTLNIKPTDVEYKRNGTLCFSDSFRSKQILKNTMSVSMRFGTNYRQISVDKFKSLLPLLDFDPTIFNNENNAFYYNEDEAMVNPLKLTQKCIDYVMMFEHTHFIQNKVIGFNKKTVNDKDIIDSVLLENGESVNCDFVILSSGTNIGTMMSWINRGINFPIIESKGLLVEYRSKHNISKNMPFLKKFSGNNNYSFMVRNEKHLIMSGGYSYSQKALNDRDKYKKEICSKWLPHLEHRGIKESDCNVFGPYYRPMPKDGKPIIGFVDDTNVYISIMHSGVTLSPLVSRLIVNEFILKLDGNNHKVDMLEPFRLCRFDKSKL